jgi:dihydrofolate reductase
MMDFNRIYAIAACDPQGVLGRAGKLPWHCPEDLQHFSKTTCNHIVVMGFHTFLNFPKGYFKERLGIVLSRQHHPNENNVIFVKSLEEFLGLKYLPEDKDIFIIGGAQIYSLFLQANLIRKVILTELKQSYEGDTIFPLSLIHAWPHQKIQEHALFCVYHYLNPKNYSPNKN